MWPKMRLLVSSDCPCLAFEALHHGVMGLLGLADPALQYAVEEAGLCPGKSHKKRWKSHGFPKNPMEIPIPVQDGAPKDTRS